MGRKFGGGLRPPFGEGGAGSPSNTKSPGLKLPPRQVPASSIQPFGRNKHGPKIWWGAPPPFGEGKRGLHLTQSRLGRGLASHQVTSWSMQGFGRNRYGRKLGGCAPLGAGEGAGSPSNTMWPGPRPTCTPSFILIRPTVWPQYTNFTDRTDEQTDRTDRQRTDSIGWTVLQTFAQKQQQQLITHYVSVSVHQPITATEYAFHLAHQLVPKYVVNIKIDIKLN